MKIGIHMGYSLIFKSCPHFLYDGLIQYFQLFLALSKSKNNGNKIRKVYKVNGLYKGLRSELN